MPLCGGLVGSEALRCYVEKCAFSLSTQAQERVRDLAEYRRVKPAHYPTSATSGEKGFERNLLWAYHPICFRTRLVLCVTGVLELDLTCNVTSFTFWIYSSPAQKKRAFNQLIKRPFRRP